ncbi:O-methyltransferase [Rhodanobacter sp. Si-c]|uniref:O-methyltransferase n=1 Tax=Rhodanobacter lycopersici TaxID=3162487 RepID=A0ABV3QC88_9GAMM
MTRPAFPDGHFYSPVVDVAEVQRDLARLWPAVVNPGPLAELMKVAPTEPTVHGIDWAPASHDELLRGRFPALIEGYDYLSEGAPDETLERFHEGNSQFGPADARVLFCMLRMLRPRHIVEVGSGYSTLLMTDVNARFLDRSASITSVEPYPRPFLHRMRDAGHITLIEQRAQDVQAELYMELEAGDVLFIDSSHVCKTGSDVTHLYLDVLPSLAPGVIVHIHDIFFPHDYPPDWVLEHGFSWNEQYLLQALLVGNRNFRVIYGGSLARTFHRPALVEFFGRMTHGSSLWLEKLA